MHSGYRNVASFAFIAILSFLVGCSASASKPSQSEVNKTPANNAGAKIAIEPNSPADTVRVFYKYLREKKIREAIFLTNLRPAIEGLTDAELKEFQVDFERVALHVPADIQINGEIISGDVATVTANLPNNDDLDASEIQEIRLRRENGVWVILTVDEAAEAKIKAEGKNYFYSLKIETHQDDARDMLEHISKAQIAHSAANQGKYADIPKLIADGLLSQDASSSETTGYNYNVKLSDHNRKYSATASPAVYGKTGKLTFYIELDKQGQAHLTSRDTGGK
jgi:hypothetical protein